MRRSGTWVFVAVLAVAAGIAACTASDPAMPHGPAPVSLDDAGDGSASSADAGCVRDLPVCPDAGAPSYASQVKSIVVGRCVYCHSPTGTPPEVPDLSTYADLHGNFGACLSQVYACAMPPSTEDPLPPADKTTLLTWLVCGAPDN